MAKKNFYNLVQLLKTRGFIDLVRVTRNDRDYFLADYGSPGTLLRQNVLKQWWEQMVLQQSNVFPIESPTFQSNPYNQSDTSRSQNADANWRESLQQDCVSKYLQVLKLTNGMLPISVVSVGTCMYWRDVPKDEPEEKVLLFGGSNLTQLLLQNYTPPTGTSAVFDYWLQLRLSWWKKFSRNPANFLVTSSNSKNNNSNETNNDNKLNSQPQHSMCIIYQFPWGPETIEEVRNLGDKPLASLQENGDQSYKGKTVGNISCLPHCIECCTSIEYAMAAWLIDSFHEKQQFPSSTKQGKLRSNTILQLHSQIAPYQVVIVISSPSPQSSSDLLSSSIELRNVCDQLRKDLCKAGISALNASLHGSTVEAHLKRNDQLGVLYTVIVTSASLTDGVISIRHRDTGIQTASHMSNVVNDLIRNLRAQLEEHE